MQLSKHFTLREMTNSMTAQRKGIDNTPGAGEIKSLGDFKVMINLHSEVQEQIVVKVISQEETK